MWKSLKNFISILLKSLLKVYSNELKNQVKVSKFLVLLCILIIVIIKFFVNVLEFLIENFLFQDKFIPIIIEKLNF